jgi:hypothetical protein
LLRSILLFPVLLLLLLLLLLLRTWPTSRASQ